MENYSNFEISALFHHLCIEGKSAPISKLESFLTEWNRSYIFLCSKHGVLNYVVDCCLKPICFNFVNVKLSNIRSECWCLINLIMPNSLYQLFLDIFGLTISRYFWSYLCMSFLLSNSLNPGLICFRKIDQ